MTFPIAVISGKRPKYLRETLLALRENSLEGCEVHLFQEGVKNFASGRKFVAEDLREECIATFQEIFPQGSLHLPKEHLGIAVLQQSARKHLFARHKKVMILEDDFVPGPSLISVTHAMLEQAPAFAGLVSAIGDKPFTSGRHLEVRTKPFHNWAWAITRSAWETLEPHFLEYYSMVENVDYKMRPHKRIMEWHRYYGSTIQASSQDGAIDLSHALAGRIPLCTVRPRGRYIGAIGEHMGGDTWKRQGYDKMKALDEPKDFSPTLQFPSEEWLIEKFKLSNGGVWHGMA